MSVFQHIAGCQIAAVGIVDTDIVVIMVVAVAVNQHDGNLRFLHLLIEVVGVHANDDDAIQIALLSKGQITLVCVSCGNQNVIPLLASIILDASQDLAVEAILEHQPVTGFCLGDNHADQLGVAHRKASGIQIRHIVQFFNGFHNTTLGFFRNRTLATERIRNGCGCYSSQLRYIFQSCSCHGIVLLSDVMRLTA